MYIVVEQWTPNVVTLLEAVITFSFFPLLTFVAYGTDRSWWRKPVDSSEELAEFRVLKIGVEDYNLGANKQQIQRILNEVKTKEAVVEGKGTGEFEDEEEVKIDPDIASEEIAHIIAGALLTMILLRAD